MYYTGERGIAQDYNMAMEYFLKSADRGQPAALYNIGMHLFQMLFVQWPKTLDGEMSVMKKVVTHNIASFGDGC